MGLIKESDTLLYYSYIVKEFYILYENKFVEVPKERITSFACINNYIDNLFPIIKIKLTLDADTYYEIIENKDSVKFKLRIQKFYRKNTSNEIVSLYDDYLSKSFSLILDDEEVDLEKEKRNLAYQNESEKDSLFAAKNDVEFFLFDSELMKSMKKLVNVIIEDGTVLDAISYIATEIGIDNLLITRPDNLTHYDQMFIPPLKMSSALSFLDTYYGIHETGSIIYFGMDRGYLIKYQGQCTSYEPNEKKEVTIIVPKALSTSSNHICELKRKEQPENKFLITDYNTIEFRDDSISENMLNGNDVLILDAVDGNIITTGENDDAIERIITNKGDNPYFKSIFKAQINSNKTIINAQFRSIDLSNLTPNKRFKFIFEDTELSRKYKGDYILVKFNMSLIREGNEFISLADCTFRKSEE